MFNAIYLFEEKKNTKRCYLSGGFYQNVQYFFPIVCVVKVVGDNFWHYNKSPTNDNNNKNYYYYVNNNIYERKDYSWPKKTVFGCYWLCIIYLVVIPC